MNRKPYRIGVIDLGSNTARLIVMQAIPGYAYRIVDEIREVVRLQQGMTKKGLHKKAVERAFSTLRLFKRFCDTTHVDTILTTATAAVRDAPNGPAFIERVSAEINLDLQIIDGEREAYLGVLGVLNEVPFEEGYVLDIGGGSAQTSEVRKSFFHKGQSFTLGALALTERFVAHDPIKASEVKNIQKEIDHQLDTAFWAKKIHAPTLVGLGGTIRNLARIACLRHDYPLNTLHGVRLTRADVEKTIDLLRHNSNAKRKHIPGLNEDRADIILPGAMVVATVMDRLGVEDMAISTCGLREGVFLEQFWEHLPRPTVPEIKRFGVLNLARNYHYQKHHTNHVRFLCERLFDQLSPLHGYGLPELELLDAAAMLHDIGNAIGYDDHHKHSQTLIQYNGLPGFTPREIALIALLTRFHRKGKPNILDYKTLLDKDDEKLLLCLSALLRLAEFLERGRNAAVDDVSVTWTDDTLHISLIADEFPIVEMWQSEQHAVPLARAAFDRKVRLDSLAAPGPWPGLSEDDDDENNTETFPPPAPST
ncbi:MAG: Ppx/GppA phosphatase family protein [bacterium]|nr:Ppx/GppA phosphatase family protein [bacterium]